MSERGNAPDLLAGLLLEDGRSWVRRRRRSSGPMPGSPSEFARLFLNEWCAGEDRLVTAADRKACITLTGDQQPRLGGPLRRQYGHWHLPRRHHPRRRPGRTDQDRGGEPESIRIVVDHARSWVGSRDANVDLGDVERHLCALTARSPKLRVKYDPSQVIGLWERLGDYGLAMRFDFTAASAIWPYRLQRSST